MAYSKFSYNGISFSEPFQVLEHQKKFVFDSARNYLYTRHTFRVRANYNPSTTSYGVPPGQNNQPAPQQDGNPPAQTEVNVRQQLAQSRGQLTYQVGSDYVLQSPAPGGYSVDANNGPVSVVHGVWERKGRKTFCCDFTVSTDVNEAIRYVKQPPYVLSHLWRMRNVVGIDCYTTRIINGTIICRSDLLLGPNAAGPNPLGVQLVPDDFRQQLTFPVPQNFIRESIDVVASEDGTSCEYTIIDRELPVNISFAQGIVKINSSWGQTYSMTGSDEYLFQKHILDEQRKLGVIGSVGSSVVGIAGKGGVGSFASIPVVGGLSYLNSKLAFNLSVKSLNRATAPRVTHVISAEMWGNAEITTVALHSQLCGFLYGRYNLITNIIQQYFSSASFETFVDHSGKYVTGNIVLHSGPLSTNGNSVTGFIQNTGLGFMNVAPDAGVSEYVTTQAAANPLPPGREGCAGDYLGAVVASALVAQNAPPIPPATQWPQATNISGGRAAGNKNTIGQ